MPADTDDFFAMHRHGFVRVAAATPRVLTAEVGFNREAILAEAQRAHEAHVDLVVYPELALSSYALDDLHLQSALLDAVEAAAAAIVEASAGLTPVLLVGAPLRRDGRLYNCALVIARGRLLGVAPKSYLPNYREYWKEAGYVEEMTAIEAAIKKNELDRLPSLMSDRWLADVTLFGPAAKVREGVEAWRAAGITTPILVPSSVGGNQMQALDELFRAFA